MIQRPYVIVAPSYTRKSAGCVVLHTLCDRLNSVGQKAYVTLMTGGIVSPYLNTPQFTGDDWQFYEQEDIEPIYVYPEIIEGNPYNAKSIVRYMLAAPGAYGVDIKLNDTDKIWSFSKGIARQTRSPFNVLCCPIIDLDEFKPSYTVKREGSCFYSNKYDRIFGHTLLPLTQGATRLDGTRAENIALLQRSEVCYVYENSMVTWEATLCGCPVVLVKTDFFNDANVQDDMGWAGVKWSDQEGEPERNVFNAYADYHLLSQRFKKDLLAFIKDTQNG